MNRKLLLAPVAPLALLQSGCFAHLISPSSAADTWSREYPDTVHRQVPAAEAVMARWQLPPDSPWAPYSKYTLISSLGQTAQDAMLPNLSQLPLDRAQCAGNALAQYPLPPDMMVMLDLRGVESVMFASAMSASPQRIAPVLTFNNWPAQNEVIPAEETLAALISAPPRMPAPGQRATPVFLLDAWRLAFKQDPIGKEQVDNRYLLTAADLPDAAKLRAEGISRVLYVVEDAFHAQAEDDVLAILAEYRNQGIGLYMVDVDRLCRATFPPSWPIEFRWVQWLRPYGYEPVWRETIYTSHGFAVGGHSGFGGVHALSTVAAPFHGASPVNAHGAVPVGTHPAGASHVSFGSFGFHGGGG